MFFQNSVTLQGIVSSHPKIIKQKDDSILLTFRMFTDKLTKESGEVITQSALHHIKFLSNYPTTYEHMKKGHEVIVTGSIVNDNNKSIIKVTSVNWKPGQLSHPYTVEEETFEANIDE